MKIYYDNMDQHDFPDKSNCPYLKNLPHPYFFLPLIKEFYIKTYQKCFQFTGPNCRCVVFFHFYFCFVLFPCLLTLNINVSRIHFPAFWALLLFTSLVKCKKMEEEGWHKAVMWLCYGLISFHYGSLLFLAWRSQASELMLLYAPRKKRGVADSCIVPALEQNSFFRLILLLHRHKPLVLTDSNLLL